MPYSKCGKCVYKKDTGKKVGCTKGNADDYLAALHANTNEETEIDMEEKAIQWWKGIANPQRRGIINAVIRNPNLRYSLSAENLSNRMILRMYKAYHNLDDNGQPMESFSLVNIYKRVIKEAKKKEDKEEKTPWSTGDRKSIKDYPMDLETAEKKIKAAGSLEKLDKTFQEVLVLMDNGKERDELRATYKELRDKKKKNWKPKEDKVTNKNFK